MFVKLQAESRDNFTKSGTSNLRKNGRIPAVVYGKHIPDTPLSVDEKELLRILREQPNAWIDLEVEGRFSRPAVIQEVQRDAFAHRILSVGFHQVEKNEQVRVKVHLELLLEPRDKELEVQFLFHELEVQCLPDLIPFVLQLDPEPLRNGRAILVKDIALPEGVKAVLPAEDVVVTLLHTAAEQVDAAAEGEAATA